MDRSVFFCEEEKLNVCVQLYIDTFGYIFKIGMNNLITYHSK